jgi:beta-glucosidase
MEQLDEMVKRIVRSIYASGIIEHPFGRSGVDAEADGRVAQRLAEKTAVLLKNSRATLPLDRREVDNIAVIGSAAGEAPPQIENSSATVDPIDPDTPLTGIRALAPDPAVHYDDGADPEAAAALARDADVAIVYASDELGEGIDRSDLGLSGNADELIRAVAAANPRTVVVLMTGSAVTMPWLGSVPAVLEAWYPGERGGHAIARLLFGKSNPSGRLPLSFPANVSDLPTYGERRLFPGDADMIEYAERLLMGYRWYDQREIEPLFPFGHGLSYGGRFRYSDVEIDRRSATKPDPVRDHHRLARLRFTITNEGKRRASEVPQVYAGFPRRAGEPPKRLVGFRKLTLHPGATKTVRIPIDDRALAYWDSVGDRWAVASGRHPICVGASAADLRGCRTLMVHP